MRDCWRFLLFLITGVGVVAVGCAVDPSGIPPDAGTAVACEDDPNVCDDGVDCTDDACTGGTCSNTPLDSRCSSGEVCFADVGCQPESACDAVDCEAALANPLTCQVGACQPDGTCAGQSGCGPGESCCGDGTCMNCDDDNPCTADSCSDGACVHEPLSDIDCDDGVFCNGNETCMAGVCTSSGDPCDSPTVCDVDRCVGCRNANDCPDPLMPAFGTCNWGGNICSESGTRSRTITTFACVDSECIGTESPETRACSRDRDGFPCDTEMLGSWSGCSGFSGTCGEVGSRTRDRTTYACASGSCISSTASETGSCMRDTDGTTCMPTQTGSWSACAGFDDVCDEGGTQERLVITYDCAGGSCGSTNTMEMRACSRPSTDGVSCGAETVTPGTCVYPSACAETGMQEVTTITPTCDAGSCTMVTTVTMEPCTRVTEGDPCGAAGPCGGACSGGACDASANDDVACDDGLSCTDQDACSGGVCVGRNRCGGGSNTCTPGCSGGETCTCVEAGTEDTCSCM